VSTKPKPQFGDIDAWGLTHPGKVREANQDHFLVGALTNGVQIDATSLGYAKDQVVFRDRSASVGVVADGVGGSMGGEHAARVAVEALVQEVSRSFHHAQFAEAKDPDVFSRLLHDAALACHESLLQQAEEEPEKGSFATALTFFLGLWPHAYLLQVGDTRCYIHQNGRLTQITRDQTWAQDLIDTGTLSQTRAQASRWANVLSSSIGGQESTPVVTRIERTWGDVVLLCSDGLTKHVSDERIAERIANMTSSRQLAEDLLQDTLDDGGTDNVTIIVGRTLRPEGG
jgi:serine/threonine protein phosphatase PrpC